MINQAPGLRTLVLWSGRKADQMEDFYLKTQTQGHCGVALSRGGSYAEAVYCLIAYATSLKPD